jgi:hypothetical protein
MADVDSPAGLVAQALLETSALDIIIPENGGRGTGALTMNGTVDA